MGNKIGNEQRGSNMNTPSRNSRNIIAWTISLVMLMATVASIAYADSIAVTSLWTDGNTNSIAVAQGESPPLFVLVTSTNDFALWIQVLRGNTVVQEVIQTFVPANLNSNYFQTFNVPTSDLAGDYLVRVHVLNVDGDSTAWLNLHVETSPTMNPVADQELNEGATLALTASGSDADGDAVTYVARRDCKGVWLCNVAEAFTPSSQNRLLPGMTFNQQTGALSFTPGFDFVKHPNAERTAGMRLHAFDGERFGNWEYADFTVNDVNRLPVFTSTPVTPGKENAYYVYPLTATDADAEDALTFSLMAGPAGMSLTPNNVVRWTPTFDQTGQHDVTVQVADGIGTVTQSYTITVANTNRAPVLNPIGNKQVSEGQLLQFTVSASDPDGDAFSLESTNLPTGAAFNQQTGQFSWTPTLTQAGQHQVTFRAMDSAALYDLETVTITVLNTNNAPVVAPVDDQSVDEGELLQFTVSATDADGDALIFATSGWPAGAGLVNHWDGTATFSWTPTSAQAGTYGLTFSVSDGTTFPFVQETFTVTVRDVSVPQQNQAPVLAPIGNKQVNEGQTLSFTVTAADADGDPLTFGVQNRPVTATFDPATQTFSWMPGFNDAGLRAVTFTVSDGKGGIDAEAVMITVVDVPVAPVPGCTDPTATNYNPNATQDNGSCTYPPQPVPGCTDSNATNFNPNATTDDGSCVYQPPPVPGCTDPTATNYNPNATQDNGSCTYPPQPVPGCTDSTATNFNPNATVNDGSCVYQLVNRAPVITSFTFPPQLTVGQPGQFSAAATDADGDPLTFNWTFGDGQTSAAPNSTHSYATVGQKTVTMTVSDGRGGSAMQTGTVNVVPVVPVVIPGCTNPAALNFNPAATTNDGSCQLAGKDVTLATVQLPDVASAGDYLAVNVVAKNTGKQELKNLQVTVMVYDLNTWASSNHFTLKAGKSSSKLVSVPVPYDTWPGSYLVKITVDNGEARYSTYRQVWVQ